MPRCLYRPWPHGHALLCGPHPHCPIITIPAPLTHASFISAGRCRRLPARAATYDELAAAHTHVHIKNMARLSASHLSPTEDFRLPMPPDTYSNEYTYQCAQLAAGSAAHVAQVVVRGEAPCGAAIVRPPGEAREHAHGLACV
jgi:acetoin utilization deacetylase AcuC-like enzyme